ncbi:MAG: DUF4214 domain-containing protein [Thermoanaerobaculia bacterium]
MRNRSSSIAAHAAAAAVCILLSIVMTWPLATKLTTAVSDPGDPYLNAWILDWDAWALTHQPGRLFDANLFHPARYALAFSENLFGIAIVMFPLHLLGLGAITVLNISMILGFAFCAYGAYLLGRQVARSHLAGMAAGAAFAFLPYRFDHLAHVQIVWSGWLPIVLAAILSFAEKPTRHRAALFAGALTMNGLTNIHWLLFGTLAAIFTVVLLAPRLSAVDRRNYWIRAAAAFLVCAVVLLPFLLPYREASAAYAMTRNAMENTLGSAVPGDWLVAGARNQLHGASPLARSAAPERALFPGVAITVLAGIGLIGTRRRLRAHDTPLTLRAGTRVATVALDFALIALVVAWFLAIANGRFDFFTKSFAIGAPPWRVVAIALALAIVRLCIAFPRAFQSPGRMNLRDAVRSSPSPGLWAASLWTVVGFLGSLGLNGFFHTTLFTYLDAFQGIRTPARWSMIAYTGLAALAAAGVAVLTKEARRFVIASMGNRGVAVFASAALGVTVFFAIVWELRAPVLWYLEPRPVAEVYAWIAKLDPETIVVEIPFATSREARYVLASTMHHRRLVNGVSGFYPRLHESLRAESNADPISDGFLDALELIGTGVVVVHNEDLGISNAMKAWIRNNIESGRLEPLGSFEHGVGGDYAFAIAKNRPRKMIAVPDQPRTASGRTARERLETFLSEKSSVHVGGPAGVIASPHAGEQVGVGYEFSGWAIAAAGIERVDLLFQNGRVRVPAQLRNRPEIADRYSWLRPGQACWFEVKVETRPLHVRESTDLQVEIVDRRGHLARLEPIFFTWTNRKPLRFDNWKAEELGSLLSRLGVDSGDARDRVLRDEVSIQTVANSLIVNAHLRTNGEFVASCYRAILGREADSKEVRLYVRMLARKRERWEVVDSLLLSEEFARRHLRDARAEIRESSGPSRPSASL